MANNLLQTMAKTSCDLLGFEGLTCVDAHCHLDFAQNAYALAKQGEQEEIGFFSGTVTPQRYEVAARSLEASSNVRVGLGLHPWWVSEHTFIAHNEEESQIQQFARLARKTPYINEVGLDFSPAHANTKDAQVKAFKAILASLAPGAIISIHSVKAFDVVFELLQQTHTLANNSCIFHWFSGSNIQLQQAIKVGCYFSVGERFLLSKRGREYSKVIPRHRLLLETDLPAQQRPNTTFEELRTSLGVAQDLLLKYLR